jgi:hypothetical protein
LQGPGAASAALADDTALRRAYRVNQHLH